MDSQNIVYYTSLLSESNHNDEFLMDSSPGQINPNQSIHVSAESSQLPAQIETTKRTQRTRNFTNAEDLLLISAWLNISMDAVHGKDQKKGTHWERICDYFHKYKTFDSDRNKNSLMNRWSNIQIAVNKFCGCYAQIDGRHQSGVTEQDKISQAKQLYEELHSASFQYEHYWNELRYQPKWLEDGQKKKARVVPSSNLGVSSPSTPNSVNLGSCNAGDDALVDIERPLGRKAAKEQLRKSKNKGHDSPTKVVLTYFEQIRERKEEVAHRKMELLELAYIQEQERSRREEELHQIEKERNEREKEKFQLEKERIELEKMKEEQKILCMDLSKMSSTMAELYRSLQENIIKKRLASSKT